MNISKVRPITIINIDSLILYADFLKLKKITLNNLIDAYIKFGQFNEKKQYKHLEELKGAYGESLLGFSYFIDHYTNVGFKGVPMALREEVFRNIFPK